MKDTGFPKCMVPPHLMTCGLICGGTRLPQFQHGVVLRIKHVRQHWACGMLVKS